MTLLDFESYKNKKYEVIKVYSNRKAWAKMTLVNIAKVGFFSSDRTIVEYNKYICNL